MHIYLKISLKSLCEKIMYWPSNTKVCFLMCQVEVDLAFTQPFGTPWSRLPRPFSHMYSEIRILELFPSGKGDAFVNSNSTAHWDCWLLHTGSKRHRYLWAQVYIFWQRAGRGDKITKITGHAKLIHSGQPSQQMITEGYWNPSNFNCPGATCESFITEVDGPFLR